MPLRTIELTAPSAVSQKILNTWYEVIETASRTTFKLLPNTIMYAVAIPVDNHTFSIFL
jgi:hypothetical protein